MSSSTDSRPRARVLRGAGIGALRAPVALHTDLGPDSGALAGFDPERVADALARGHRDGYAAGHAEGAAAGHAEATAAAAAAHHEQHARVERALLALGRATAELEERAAVDLAALEVALVDAAVDLAEAVVGRAVATSPRAGRDALVRALALATPGVAALARLHPEDAAALDVLDAVDPGRVVTVVADPAVERGGCVVEAGDCRVDAQLGPALARARAALLDEVVA